MVWKANDVWVQNLTACNFLHGKGDTGNEIWWNGGDGTVKGGIGGHGYLGSYLTATSTFFKTEETAAQYGIFSSNWNGGTWDQTYASNFNDSGYYIGACQQAVQPGRQPRARRVQRARLLGLELGRHAGRQELRVRQQRGRVRHQQPERRQPAAAERRLPEQRHQPDHAHPLVLGVHEQLRARQQQPERPGFGAAAAGPGRHRDVDLGRSQRHGHEQPVREQQGVGRSILVPFPDSGKPCNGGTLELADPRLGQLLCSTSGATRSSATRSRTTAATATRPTATSRS